MDETQVWRESEYFAVSDLLWTLPDFNFCSGKSPVLKITQCQHELKVPAI